MRRSLDIIKNYNAGSVIISTTPITYDNMLINVLNNLVNKKGYKGVVILFAKPASFIKKI